MFQAWLLNVALMYLVEELITFATTGDWTTLLMNVDAKVRMAVPGSRWDDTCVRFVNKLLHAVQQTITDKVEITELAKDLAAKRYDEAIADVKKLIADHWLPEPGCADGAAVLAACKAA